MGLDDIPPEPDLDNKQHCSVGSPPERDEKLVEIIFMSERSVLVWLAQVCGEAQEQEESQDCRVLLTPLYRMSAPRRMER